MAYRKQSKEASKAHRAALEVKKHKAYAKTMKRQADKNKKNPNTREDSLKSANNAMDRAIKAQKKYNAYTKKGEKGRR